MDSERQISPDRRDRSVSSVKKLGESGQTPELFNAGEASQREE